MMVCITGGRDFQNQNATWRALKRFKRKYGQIDIFMHGDAGRLVKKGWYNGVDKQGGAWAESLGIPVIALPAPWNDYSDPRSVKVTRRGHTFNIMAGPIRNEDMRDRLVAYPLRKFLVAMPGGSGTAHMIKICEDVGIKVVKYDETGRCVKPSPSLFG